MNLTAQIELSIRLEESIEYFDFITCFFISLRIEVRNGKK